MWGSAMWFMIIYRCIMSTARLDERSQAIREAMSKEQGDRIDTLIANGKAEWRDGMLIAKDVRPNSSTVGVQVGYWHHGPSGRSIKMESFLPAGMTPQEYKDIYGSPFDNGLLKR